MEHHVGLKESFSGGGGAVVGDFDENGGGESDGLACRDDETWLLNEFHRLPLGVAGNGLVQPLVSDCRAVQMTSRHEWELEEGGGPPVKHLNVYRVDFLQLLDEHCMVIGVQNLREGKDIITPKGDSDVSWFKDHQRAPELVDGRQVLERGREMHDNLSGLRALLYA